ncbi:threonine/serine exporter family protein [Enterococcus sp. BWR-S5]|uniref:threonine/serine exporter family protein n=1 Tax=Enterococcus sp. BWR-S5 TaxID=2787714 RepID=UPI001924701E|nr:threonine/serine exporter family protein [Enterococcus sp. BWR-S5]MBL1226289.1 threonine/serine exporter family protein [Enterococcus sp. BWR-S5]
MNIIFQFIYSYLGTVAFGVITNIPRKALNVCGITGAIGWMIFILTRELETGDAFANFFSALCIGLLSIYFSRKKKMPTIIFNIPSLVPLVPGGPAYQAVRSFVLDNYISGLHSAMTVIMTAGSIAAGFMVTNMVEKLLKRMAVKRQQQL